MNYIELSAYVTGWIGLMLVVSSSSAAIYASGFLSVSISSMWAAAGFRTLELSPSVGPLVSITWLMTGDLSRWLMLLLVPVVGNAFAITFADTLPDALLTAVPVGREMLHANLSQLQEAFGDDRGTRLDAWVSECAPLFDGVKNIFYSAVLFLQFSVGAADITGFVDCANEYANLLGEPAFVILYSAYAVVVIVLFLNM